jgi:hypothetical protein
MNLRRDARRPSDLRVGTFPNGPIVKRVVQETSRLEHPLTPTLSRGSGSRAIDAVACPQ